MLVGENYLNQNKYAIVVYSTGLVCNKNHYRNRFEWNHQIEYVPEGPFEALILVGVNERVYPDICLRGRNMNNLLLMVGFSTSNWIRCYLGNYVK